MRIYIELQKKYRAQGCKLMITWMQKHKKYLIITIWISTIAFVGAGFVGWGRYDYGNKAGAVAKVGDIEITKGELQKSYSNLYFQYSQMLQGNFDEAKAKAFGLQAQALKSLTQQALILNLAKSYDLSISDDELLTEIRSQDYFFKNGAFDKETYKQILSRNNLTIKEYEASVKKDLLIRKTIKLIPIGAKDSELNIMSTAANIADKIEYKILEKDLITVDTSDAQVKPYWEKIQKNFKTEVSYDVKYIKQPKSINMPSEAKLSEYYNENKTHFKDSEGKILTLENAKAKVTDELLEKETKTEALKTYIEYKKGKTEGLQVYSATVSALKNPFNAEALQSISKLKPTSPFLKPILINGVYFTFELVKINASKIKSYEEAKNETVPLFVDEQKNKLLQELAKKSLDSFQGAKTDFITNSDAGKLTNLSSEKANEFLSALFKAETKKGYTTLSDGNIVMYNILEQKLLSKADTNQNNPIVRLKSAMFNEGLIKNLQNKYKTEIFIQGL